MPVRCDLFVRLAASVKCDVRPRYVASAVHRVFIKCAAETKNKLVEL